MLNLLLQISMLAFIVLLLCSLYATYLNVIQVDGIHGVNAYR